MTTLDPSRIRADFPVLARQVAGRPIAYLDNAASSLAPRRVIDAMVRYHAEIGGNVHRGKHLLSEQASHEFEDARGQIAQFINAAPDEIVLVRNTTEGLNLTAELLATQPFDTVLVSAEAHHSLLLPFRLRCAVRYIPSHDDGGFDLARYRTLLSRWQPRAVLLTHCSNVTGAVYPIGAMARLAHEAGALVICDAAQSAPHLPLDVADLDVDALAFSGHKMLGPSGVGVLFLRRRFPDGGRTLLLGGGTVDWVDRTGFALRPRPHRFEAGTPNIEGVLGLAAALDYLTGLGMDRVETHGHALTAALAREVAERHYLTAIGGKPGDGCPIVSMRLPAVPDLDVVARALSDSFGVMARTGFLCAQPFVTAAGNGPVLRLSAYLYNTDDEITRAFEALDQVHATLAKTGG